MYLWTMRKRNLSDVGSGLWSQQFSAIGSVVALGIPSYLAFYFASRTLAPQDFANFVSLWTIINTVILGFFAPIESQAPRLASTSTNQKDFLENLRSLSIGAALYVIPVLLVSLSLLSQLNLYSAFLVFFSTAAYLFWNEKRSNLFGNHDLFGVFVNSAVYATTLSVLLVLCSVFFPKSFLFYICCLPIAWIIGNLISTNWRTGIHHTKLFTFPGRVLHDKRYIILAMAGFLSLFPAAQTLILAGKLIESPGDYASFVGVVMLTRLGLTITNSITPTFSLSYVKNLGNNKKYKSNLMLHFAAFSAAAVAGIGIFMVFGTQLLFVFLKTEMNLTAVQITLIVVSESILAATVATKTQLIALGINRGQLWPWVLGAAAYSAVLFFAKDILGLTLATATAGAFVICGQLLSLAIERRRLL